MNKKESQVYKKALEQKKEQIVRKLSEVYHESKDMETEVAQDLVDKAETSYTKEFLLSLSDTERNQLFLIDQALRRIAGGKFGICQSCGQPVNKKRLDAVPWTQYCIECQEKIENDREAEIESL